MPFGEIMGRFKFILFLVLLAVFLLFFSHTLRSFLSLTAGSLPLSQTVPQPQRSSSFPLQNELRKQTHQWLQLLVQLTPLQKAKTYTPPAACVPPPAEPSANPAVPFLQITLEDLRPPLRNPHFPPEISVLLDEFLAKRRQYNAELVDSTEEIFGESAKKEVIAVLIRDEQASTHNAKTCKTRQDFAQRQRQINQQTSQKLYETFLRHRRDINRRAATMSPAWKAFFKRVRDYQRIANGTAEESF